MMDGLGDLPLALGVIRTSKPPPTTTPSPAQVAKSRAAKGFSTPSAT